MKMGFFGFLTCIFVVLKLLGVIAWSWWLVFLPLIISVVLVVATFILNLVLEFKK
jgi:hypothetical protein